MKRSKRRFIVIACCALAVICFAFVLWIRGATTTVRGMVVSARPCQYRTGNDTSGPLLYSLLSFITIAGTLVLLVGAWVRASAPSHEAKGPAYVPPANPDTALVAARRVLPGKGEL